MKDYIFTRDSLLIAGFGGQDPDIYKRYAVENDDNFQLIEKIISDFSSQVLYGILRSSWDNFRRYLDNLRFNNNDSLRVIYLPVNYEVNGEVLLVYDITFLDFRKREILFYSGNGVIWKGLDDNEFAGDLIIQNIGLFCDHLNQS